MSNRRRTSSVKIRNKKYDKTISIVSAVLLSLSLILFIALPLIKVDMPGIDTKSFNGLDLLFGVEHYIKTNWIAVIVVIAVFVALILNIIGIFDRRFCLFSGMLMVLTTITFVFIKSTVIPDSNLINILNLKFSNQFSIYIIVTLFLVSSLGQLYITTSEEFD